MQMSTSIPVVDRRAILKMCGELADWKIAAIERSRGSLEELEVALAWAAGESDVMGKERHPLAGSALRLYEILMADEDEWEEP
jgi:hypothetical protein